MGAVTSAQTLSGGRVSIDMNRDGTVQSVAARGQVLSAGSAPGGIFIRDLRRVDVPGTVLFADGFEDSSHGWDYYKDTQLQELTIKTSNYAAHTGRSSLLVKVEPASSIQKGRIISPESFLIPVRPGKRYRVQCVVKATRGYLSAHPSSLTIQRSLFKPSDGKFNNGIGLFWLDAAGVPVSDHVTVAPFMDQAKEWKAVGGTVTAPEGAVSARVSLSVNLDPDYDLEGYFVDQVEFFEDGSRLEKVLGSLTATGNGRIAFASKIDTFKVDVAIISLADGLMFTGTVRALDGKSHPLDLHLSIPVNADGWTWPMDAEEDVVIDSTVSSWYANEISYDSQSNLPASLYPYGGVHGTDSGIALCVPLEPAFTAAIGYDAARQCLEVRFRLGIDPETGRHEAGFTACLFDYDSGHGFRGIIAAYRRLFQAMPHWFTTPFDPSLFSRWITGMFHSSGGARTCLQCDKNGYLACQYLGSDFLVEEIVPGGQQPPPTLDQIVQLVALRGRSSDPVVRYYYTCVWDEIMRSHNNDPVLKACGDENSSNGWIQATFNITPSIVSGAEGYIRYVREHFLIPAFRDTSFPEPSWNVDPSVLDAVMLDNFLNQSSIDFDTDHIAWSAQDLTYTQNSYRAGLTPAAGACDMARWLRTWLDLHVPPPRRQVAVNWAGIGTCNAAVPWIDLFVDEVFNAVSDGEYGIAREGSFDPAILRYKRAVVFQKYRCQEFNGTKITRSDVKDHLHTYLLHAMGAMPDEGIAFKQPALFGKNQCLALVEAHNAIVADLHNAGWEPVTHAGCATPDTYLERYGTPGGGEFYIVMLNDGTTAASGTITLRAELGLTAKPVVFELIAGTNYTVHGSGPEWTFDFQTLLKRRALVFRIE